MHRANYATSFPGIIVALAIKRTPHAPHRERRYNTYYKTLSQAVDFIHTFVKLSPTSPPLPVNAPPRQLEIKEKPIDARIVNRVIY